LGETPGGRLMLGSILDVEMICPLCGWKGTVKDCEPDADGDGGLGCPVEDCGGMVDAAPVAN
jgi:hypothetical protein